MKAKRIMCPTDFSDQSDAAIGYATKLAKESGATLYIVHVKDPPETFAAGSEDFPLAYIDAKLYENLNEVTPLDPDVGFAQKLLTGFPDRELVRFAEEEDIDLIVMGTHGRTGFNRILMGSVAEAVVRRAGCPVLTIKLPKVRQKV